MTREFSRDWLALRHEADADLDVSLERWDALLGDTLARGSRLVEWMKAQPD